MKIDLVSDRVERRPDPVEAKVGVFAHLDAGEMTEVEIGRLGSAGAKTVVRKKPEEPKRRWLPKDILRRVTNLYKRLGKPREKV